MGTLDYLSTRLPVVSGTTYRVLDRGIRGERQGVETFPKVRYSHVLIKVTGDPSLQSVRLSGWFDIRVGGPVGRRSWSGGILSLYTHPISSIPRF